MIEVSVPLTREQYQVVVQHAERRSVRTGEVIAILLAEKLNDLEPPGPARIPLVRKRRAEVVEVLVPIPPMPRASRRNANAMTEYEISEIRRLNGEGHTDTEIARMLGRQQPAVSARRRAMGLPVVDWRRSA